jgi:hypothetical protein
MLKIKEIKQLIFQLTLLLVLFISFKHIFVNLQSNPKQANKLNKKKAPYLKQTIKKDTKIDQLRSVERINAYIEEQYFLLSAVEENNINNKEILKSIESSLLKIEQDAKKQQITQLINSQKIKDLKENIKRFEQILIQKES